MGHIPIQLPAPLVQVILSPIIWFSVKPAKVIACTGVIGSPSVNLFVDPLGGVRLISSHEQMFCPPYRVIGSSFPQSSVPPVPLTEAALAVGRACYNASKSCRQIHELVAFPDHSCILICSCCHYASKILVHDICICILMAICHAISFKQVLNSMSCNSSVHRLAHQLCILAVCE